MGLEANPCNYCQNPKSLVPHLLCVSMVTTGHFTYFPVIPDMINSIFAKFLVHDGVGSTGLELSNVGTLCHNVVVLC